MKLTRATIGTLPLPADARKADCIYFDDDVPGFGCRVRKGGSKTFIVQYEQGLLRRRMTLGSAKLLDPATARSRARDIMAAVRLGRDPAGEKLEFRVRAAETFGKAVERFLERQRVRLRPRSYSEVERHLDRQAKPLHRLPLAKIDRRTIAGRLSELAKESGPIAADRCRASLSALFAWAIREGLADSNPVTHTNRASEDIARSRVLENDELAEIWAALPKGDYGDIVRLLLLTGQRRLEIGDLRWPEIDLDKALITLPAERVKNKRPHEVSLSAPALNILKQKPRREGRERVFGRGEGGFSGWSRCKEDLDRRIHEARRDKKAKPVPEWRLHDLRRTMSTKMADDLGVVPHVIDAVTNHVSGQSVVHRTYNYAQYRAEKAAALALWAERVMAIVGGRPASLVPLRRATP